MSQITWPPTACIFKPFLIHIRRYPVNHWDHSMTDGFTSPIWWRYQMEAFSALLAPCEGNLPVTGGSPSQRPVTRGFDVFFDLRLSKQSRRRWFERPSRLLWRHCNAAIHPLSQPGGIRGTVQLKTRISHSTTCKLMLSLVVPSSHYLSGTITNTTIMLLDQGSISLVILPLQCCDKMARLNYSKRNSHRIPIMTEKPLTKCSQEL